MAICRSRARTSALHLPRQPESSSTGHFNLGLAYARRAKDAEDSAALLERAEAEMRLALETEQRFARAYVELGKVLARQQRNREAIRLYLDAEAIEPENYRIQHALGLLYRRVGDLAEAERRFRRALETAPGHAASATRLGDVLLQTNQPQEAVRAFAHALRLNPQDNAARRGMAEAQTRLQQDAGPTGTSVP